MDRASGPITGTARRTWESFKGETLSGNAGAEAAKYVVGGGLAAGVYYVINRAFDANAGDS